MIIPPSPFMINSRRNGTASFDNGRSGDRFTPGKTTKSLFNPSVTMPAPLPVPFTRFHLLSYVTVPSIVQELNVRAGTAKLAIDDAEAQIRISWTGVGGTLADDEITPVPLGVDYQVHLYNNSRAIGVPTTRNITRDLSVNCCLP